MAIRIRRASAFEVREPVVQFFWRMQAWPFPTQEDYYRYWDWRHTSLSESDPVVWIATDGDAVVGHMAVNFRNLRAGEHPTIRVGIPANFRVDEAYQNTMVGARLAGSPRTLVRDGEIDMILGYGNETAHAMFVGLGARDLGVMGSFVDVRQWRPILARRFAGAGLLAPVAHLAAGARRAILRRGLSRGPEGLVARELSVDEVLTMDRSHWSRSERLVSDDSPALLANRFLKSPFRSHRVFGIVDENSHRLQGLVVTEGTAQVTVWKCEVNDSALSEVHAVDLVLNACESAESVIVPLLPESALADDFRRAGFIRRPEGDPAPAIRTAYSRYDVAANTWWSAYSLPANPLASVLADSRRWNTWYAWGHH